MQADSSWRKLSIAAKRRTTCVRNAAYTNTIVVLASSEPNSDPHTYTWVSYTTREKKTFISHKSSNSFMRHAVRQSVSAAHLPRKRAIQFAPSKAEVAPDAEVKSRERVITSRDRRTTVMTSSDNPSLSAGPTTFVTCIILACASIQLLTRTHTRTPAVNSRALHLPSFLISKPVSVVAVAVAVDDDDDSTTTNRAGRERSVHNAEQTNLFTYPTPLTALSVVCTSDKPVCRFIALVAALIAGINCFFRSFCPHGVAVISRDV